MKKALFGIAVGVLALISSSVDAAACTETGFYRDGINMTAAVINPSATVTGVVDASGCNIGVYVDNGSYTIKNAEIKNPNYFGVLVNGDAGNVAMDVIGGSIHDIGETPLNGTQHGVAIYYRSFFLGGSATGKVSGVNMYNYQKGGVVVNGVGSNAVVTGNTVAGQGPVDYIAQNGIQFGYGSTGSAMKNTVTGHQYIGDSAFSGGIIVVGGAGYGTCPDGNDCPYTSGVQIVGNTVKNNDVGALLSNLTADFTNPDSDTNNKVVNNNISNDSCVNLIYQAGIAVNGRNDKVINDTVSGTGYSGQVCGSISLQVDNGGARTKVHAIK